MLRDYRYKLIGAASTGNVLVLLLLTGFYSLFFSYHQGSFYHNRISGVGLVTPSFCRFRSQTYGSLRFVNQIPWRMVRFRNCVERGTP
jgi:hypothetical protein